MKKILIATTLFLAIIAPSFCKADGGLMPSPNYWISESDQKAVLVFENNTETMVLSTTFRGDAKDFSWIVPTPSKPSVDKGSYGIFEALAELTNVYESSPLDFSMPLGTTAVQEKSAVNVIEQKKIDVYDISVLEANNQEALYNWLKDNGYNYPEYGKTVLDDYIRNKWFFTAVKINSADFALAGNRLNTGTITPLKFVFSTDRIVYPMKISSITMDESTVTTSSSAPIIPNNYVSVQLYIFADHKKQIDGFNEEYANWVDTKTIENLAKDDNGNSWYSPTGKEMYLTSLYRNMNTRDMRNDIFPIDADNNKTNPPSQFWANLLATVLILLGIIISPFGLIYIILMLLFIFLRSRVAKILFFIFQGLIALFGVIASIIFAVSLSDAISDLLPALIATLIITVAMIVGMVLEIVLGKKKGIL